VTGSSGTDRYNIDMNFGACVILQEEGVY